jgi:cell shape-determining protein MreC
VSRLSEDGRISLSDVKSDRELTAAYRDLAKRSLYFFTKGVLQYKDLTKKIKEHVDGAFKEHHENEKIKKRVSEQMQKRVSRTYSKGKKSKDWVNPSFD